MASPRMSLARSTTWRIAKRSFSLRIRGASKAWGGTFMPRAGLRSRICFSSMSHWQKLLMADRAWFLWLELLSVPRKISTAVRVIVRQGFTPLLVLAHLDVEYLSLAPG